MRTAGQHGASIRRASVVVVAVHGRWGARAACTDVGSRARIVVVADGRVRDVHAAGDRVATVVGAAVQIVTIERRTCLAIAAIASVADRAHAAIGVAGQAIGARGIVLARPVGHIATINGARIVVVAYRQRTAGARAGFADIADGAAVAVAASRSIVGVRAAKNRIASIVGATVAVVAVQGRACHAVHAAAHVRVRAHVVVRVARAAGIDAGVSTHTGRWCASICFAKRIASSVTSHNRSRVHVALIRQRAFVAEKCAVAEIAVLQARAIRIGRARASIGATYANAARTRVARGAAVAVVTRQHVVGVLAAGDCVARIRGASVVVIAKSRHNDGRSFASADRARVARRTSIQVVAGQGVVAVDAARNNVTRIARAENAVITRYCSACANFGRAHVAACAGIAVVATGCIGDVDATR